MLKTSIVLMSLLIGLQASANCQLSTESAENFVETIATKKQDERKFNRDRDYKEIYAKYNKKYGRKLKLNGVEGSFSAKPAVIQSVRRDYSSAEKAGLGLATLVNPLAGLSAYVRPEVLGHEMEVFFHPGQTADQVREEKCEELMVCLGTQTDPGLIRWTQYRIQSICGTN